MHNTTDCIAGTLIVTANRDVVVSREGQSVSGVANTNTGDGRRPVITVQPAIL